MLDDRFRAGFEPLVRPVARGLAQAGVTANSVTVAAFALALLGAGLIATGRPYAGLAVWLVSRLGDGLDGAVARESRASSPFGGYLDITLDMAAYAAMVLAFAVVHPASTYGWLAVLAGYVVVITTTLALSDSARAAQITVSQTNRTFQFSAGLTEAGETSLMYTLWVLFPQHVDWLVWVWVIALGITCLQRSLLAWRVLPSHSGEGGEGTKGDE
jgi:phosphatidylglycerophosphate synthase